MNELEFTGERVVPGKVDRFLWAEHLSRYLFAAPWATGKRVLDAGCGAGYGAHLLAERGAAAVLGVDVSLEAVAYASSNYRHPALEYRQMSVIALDVPDQSFDLVVSFEVIEHLADQDAYLAEIARVLSPDGVFIGSTPNRTVYRAGEEPNRFHTREFDQEEFRALLAGQFRDVSIFAQDYVTAIQIQPLNVGAAETEDVRIDRELLTGKPPEHYFLAVCSLNARPQRHRTQLFQLAYEADSAKLCRVHLATQEIATVVPRGETYLFADNGEWSDAVLEGRRAIPFTEHEGQYWGPPSDDASAIADLERLRAGGAGFLVIAEPVFWWLEYYSGFATYVRSRFGCLLSNQRILIFKLSADS